MSRQQERKRYQQTYRRNRKNQSRLHAMWLVVVVILALGGYLKKDVVFREFVDTGKSFEAVTEQTTPDAASDKKDDTVQAELDDIPAFSGDAYIALNNNKPAFSKKNGQQRCLNGIAVWIRSEDVAWHMRIYVRS